MTTPEALEANRLEAWARVADLEARLEAALQGEHRRATETSLANAGDDLRLTAWLTETVQLRAAGRRVEQQLGHVTGLLRRVLAGDAEAVAAAARTVEHDREPATAALSDADLHTILSEVTSFAHDGPEASEAGHRSGFCVACAALYSATAQALPTIRAALAASGGLDDLDRLAARAGIETGPFTLTYDPAALHRWKAQAGTGSCGGGDAAVEALAEALNDRAGMRT